MLAITNTIDRLEKAGKLSQSQERVLRSDIVEQNRKMREYIAGRIKNKPSIKDYILRMLTPEQLEDFKARANASGKNFLNDRFSKAY